MKDLPVKANQSPEQQLSSMFARSLFQHSSSQWIYPAKLAHMVHPKHPRLSYAVYDMSSVTTQKSAPPPLETGESALSAAASHQAAEKYCFYTTEAKKRCGLPPDSPLTLPELDLKHLPIGPFAPDGYKASAKVPDYQHTGNNLPLQIELALRYLDFCTIYRPEPFRRIISDHLLTLLEPLIKPEHVDLWDLMTHPMVFLIRLNLNYSLSVVVFLFIVVYLFIR